MLIPASQGDIFQTPSWFSLICTTSYGPGNVRCTASTHVSAVHGLVIPEGSPVRRNDKRGRSPGRHHFFQHCPRSSARRCVSPEFLPVSSCGKPLSPADGGHPRRCPGAAREGGREGGTAGGDRGKGTGERSAPAPAPRAARAPGWPQAEGCFRLTACPRCYISQGGCLFFSCHLTSDSG